MCSRCEWGTLSYGPGQGSGRGSGPGAGPGSGRGSGPGSGSGSGSGSGAGSDRPTVVAARRLPGPVLRRRAARAPHGLAYEWPGGGCSYAELDLRARAVAARLGSGLPPGDRVLLAYPRGADLAGAFYGCLYAGMIAVPLLLGRDGQDIEGAVAGAVRGLRPAVVLTGGDAWTALAVDRARTTVVDADGMRVGGMPVRSLAENWSPIGVLPTASAYQRYITDGLGGGRLEPALWHGELSDVVADLAHAERLGTDRESLGWIASVHGLEDVIWRILLPVLRGT